MSQVEKTGWRHTTIKPTATTQGKLVDKAVFLQQQQAQLHEAMAAKMGLLSDLTKEMAKWLRFHLPEAGDLFVQLAQASAKTVADWSRLKEQLQSVTSEIGLLQTIWS